MNSSHTHLVDKAQKKLTPKRKNQNKISEIDPLNHVSCTPPNTSFPNTHQPEDGCVESDMESSETDDTCDDENYKIDPRELRANDEEEDLRGVRKKTSNMKSKRTSNRRLQHMVNDNDAYDDEDGVDGDRENTHGNEEHEDNGDGGELSDNSIELNEIIHEELNYDVDELFSIRTTNLSLRRSQKDTSGSVYDVLRGRTSSHIRGGQVTQQEEAREHQVQPPQTESSTGFNTLPPYFTTFDGGYVSDQRDSDDEGGLWSSDELEEIDHVVLKRSKRVNYPYFNEKSDMSNVQFTVGLKFTSQKVLKVAILWNSIQQHKDIIYLKNDKRQVHIGCACCEWEMTGGPDIEDSSGWQIKSLQPQHINCKRTF